MNKSFHLGTIVILVLVFGLVHEGSARGFGGVPGGGRGGIPGGFRGGLNLGQLHNVAATGQLNQNPGGADWTGRSAGFAPRGLGPSPFRRPQAPIGVPSAPMRRYTPPARPNTSTMLMNPALGGLANTGAALSATSAQPTLPRPAPTSPYSNYSLPSDAGLHALGGVSTFGK